MNISLITSKINLLFNKVRGAAPQIPSILLSIGGSQRPGMSRIKSVGNITTVLTNHGIPTEANEDGTENKTLVMVNAIVEEIYRALHEDANIQIAINPAGISVITAGANSGGPLIGRGINNNFVKGTAIIQ